MALKDVWKKLTEKNDSTDIAPIDSTEITPFVSEAFPVVKLSAGQLSAYKSIPLASLTSLGTAFSQLSEGARTIVQSCTKVASNGEKLYTVVNPKGIQGDWQIGKFGINGNIMRVNPQGKNIVAGRLEFREHNGLLTETTTTTLPLDPMLMVVAVALMTIEKKLNGIQKSVEEVLQFLKQEKQSKQRGNLNMLAEIMEDYKLNCQSEAFCMSRMNEVLSIKTAAYQDIDFYQNQIASELQKQKGFHGAKDAQSVLDSVTYQFAEYQLACHLFAYSSFLDILLQKNFDIALIESTTQKMLIMVKRYEELYADCHAQIAKYQRSAIETKILEGIGVATKGLGKAIGAVPLINRGPVDEALISAGDSIGKHNQEVIERKLQSFEAFEPNRMTPFIENLQSVSALYNTENAMITDGENLYILQPT